MPRHQTPPTASIEVIFQCQTALAYCVWTHESSKSDIWLPKSMVSLTGEKRRGKVVTIEGPEKILNEKGLL